MVSHSKKSGSKKVKKPHSCKQCGKSFKNKQYIVRHMKVHTGEKPYKCEYCHKRFANTSNRKAHILRHKCKRCGKKFESIALVLEHAKTHPRDKPYYCKHCLKGFTTISKMIDHAWTHVCKNPHPDTKMNIKTEASKKPDLLSLKPLLSTKRYACEQCGKKFKTNWYIAEHKRIHTGEKPYKCESCGKNFTFGAEFAKHLKTQTHRRKLCGKNSAGRVRIGQHGTDLMVYEKPYKCEHCCKSFSTLLEMVTHRMMETSETLFQFSSMKEEPKTSPVKLINQENVSSFDFLGDTVTPGEINQLNGSPILGEISVISPETIKQEGSEISDSTSEMMMLIPETSLHQEENIDASISPKILSDSLQKTDNSDSQVDEADISENVGDFDSQVK